MAVRGGCFNTRNNARLPPLATRPSCPRPDLNPAKSLNLNTVTRTFPGSLLFLFTPVGSVVSSVMLGWLGHNKCMIITNIPYMASQIMLYYAENVRTLYACSILMGLSIGYSGGPCSAYIGEVCEPKLRGTLMSATNVFYYVGSLIFTLIYAVTMNWRLTVFISLSVPVINVVVLFMVTVRHYAHQRPNPDP